MTKNFARDFHDIQTRQRQRSVLILFILIPFYWFVFFLLAFLPVSLFGILKGTGIPSGTGLTRLGLVTSLAALAVSVYHFYDAKFRGAKFIRARLGAQPPDTNDRYHTMFANTVEEMRLACGLPRVNPFVIPDFAVNSMALIESDNTPDILVTEGLLAEFTRDEIQAVVAHELAHIIRGDSSYITLICSLANFVEKIRWALGPDDRSVDEGSPAGRGGGSPISSLVMSSTPLIMRLLAVLISRQREILADSVAVEINRNPRALARAIYKAHIQNSFVGDFHLVYSPLFIVPPRSREITDDLGSRLFNSHPPLMTRIHLLSEMIPTSTSQIIHEVQAIRLRREKARHILTSRGQDSPPPPSPEDDGIWQIRNPEGRWEGPHSLEAILVLRYFTPLIRLRNDQEGIEAPAREFPQVREALKNQLRNQSIKLSGLGLCPRCRVSLRSRFYEGVPISSCPECDGNLVDSRWIGRIIARKEAGYSAALIAKAEEFTRKFMANPIRTIKISRDHAPSLSCPECGGKMLPRPFNYQYVIPVDKCFSCQKIWFDTDELEVLQILIETREPSENS